MIAQETLVASRELRPATGDRAVHLEGGLLGPDILERLEAGTLPGQQPADFSIKGRWSVLDEAAEVYRDAKDLWKVFRHRLERLPEDDPATRLTREGWVVPFLGLSGYELRYNPRAYDIDGMTFAISHRAGKNEDAPPVHIAGARRELGRVDPSGRPRLSPHALVQEFLNRSEHLWGIVTNGRLLRLLRKSTLLRRQAYVEFDLEAIFEAEGDAHFNAFVLLYRLLHRSRLPDGIADGPDCFLERYHREALEQGNRARDRLRDGVERCLQILGTGFLRANGEWRIANGEDASTHDSPFPTRHSPAQFAIRLYSDLLRLVYRFLFLLVAEERGLLGGSDLYREHYSISRLRRLADRREAYTEHDDLWHSLRVLWHLLRDATPIPQADGQPLASLIGLSVLDGGLFEPIPLEERTILNRDLLEAFYYLAYYYDDQARAWRRVNYAALDVEELGSVYESLLDNHPVIVQESDGPAFRFTEGTERKSTGSYYTPPELVQELVKSALEPVLEERLAEVKRMANSEWRMVPRTIQERFVHDYGHRLSGSRGVEAGDADRPEGVRADSGVSSAGNIRPDEPDAPGGGFHSSEHRRGMGTPLYSGVHSIPSPSQRQPDRAGNAADFEQPSGPLSGSEHRSLAEEPGSPGKAVDQPGTKPPTEEELAIAWSRTPFPIRYSLFAQEPILSIRVLDPACGSGHFLLAAARRLGKELARVRTGEEEPSPEALREAIREVVAHCIYGVDKNPLAVELCKVALWIESHVPGKPLTFLDHRIRCGDSLVGVQDQVVLQEGIPDEAYDPVAGDDKGIARSLKKRNQMERAGQLGLPIEPLDDKLLESALEVLELEEIPDNSVEAIAEKQRRFESIQREQSPIRQAANLWTAAFFQEPKAGSPGITTDAVRRALAGQPLHGQVAGLAEDLATRLHFFHWPLEFPEVFADDGFDVVMGNPPFMGGLKISGHFGARYRHWLEAIYRPFGGTADLCAAFYRRAYALLRPGGRLGMVATNTIGQGDARESGLLPIVRQGGTITFARRFIKWPGAANVEVNLVAIRKPHHSPLATRDSPSLDGQPVPFISSRLDPEPEGDPNRLPQNDGKAFIGDYVRGIGFVLEPAEAETLLAKDPRNADCLFPYLNGEDLNSDPEQKPSRWVICFHDWSLERARRYPDLLRIVEERVKPERERLRGPGDARNREYWWQFGAYRLGMRRAIAPLRRVLVRAQTSEMHIMSFVPKGWIYSHTIVVFAFDDDCHLALLQSSVHEVWVWRQGPTLESRNRYTPTDCFDTFPFPEREYKLRGDLKRLLAIPEFAEAARIGAQYHEHRRQIMLARRLGLTKTYNLFHDPSCNDADIVLLRELHAAIDRAILACYGWSDLDPGHSFYQNDRGQTRFTSSPAARRELLARLLGLNEQIAGKQRNAT